MSTTVDAPVAGAPAVVKPGRLDYLKGLDGIRGMGIICVLLYHQNVPWMAGVLTVSMFFTLSGFLITRIMVNEWQRTDTVSFSRFYDRRVRRLLPASFIVLLAIAVVWTTVPGLSIGRWDFFSGLTYWENINLIVADKDYAELFGLESPVQHLWSLSLEEQVYIVFPLLMLFLFRMRALARRPVVIAGVLAVLAAVGFALGPFWVERSGGFSRAYYGTEVRSAEFLVGAVFAVFWETWRHTERLKSVLRTRPMQLASYVLLGVAVWMWFTQYVTDPWFFPWSVLANSLVTVGLIAFFASHTGATAVTSWAPLVFLGQLAYGTYLVHWPVFLLLDEERVPVGFWTLFALRVAVTYAIVLAIFYLVEDPVRRGALLPGRKLLAPLVAIGVVSMAIVLIGGDREVENPFDPDALAMQQAALAALPELPADAPETSAVDPALPARVLVVGDSQSWIVGNALKEWGATTGVTVEPSPGTGCGIGENTPIRYLNVEQPYRSGCQEWRDALPLIAEKLDPQQVVVIGGLADLSDRELPGEDGWSHIGEPAYDAWLLDQMREFVERVTAGGATVLWLTHPYVDIPYEAGKTGTPPFEENDPARMDRYEELIRQIADEDPRVEVADFGSYVEELRPQVDGELQPDGAHLDLVVAPQIVDWIGNELRRVQATRG